MVIGKLDITVYFHITPADLYIILEGCHTSSVEIDSKNLPECILRNKMFFLVFRTRSTRVQRQGCCEALTELLLSKNGFTSYIEFA